MAAGPPELPLLVYDADCGFCTASAGWLQRRSRGFRIAGYQHLDLAALGTSAAEASAAVLWISAGEPVRRGHDAIAAALRRSRRPWSWLGAVGQLPPMRWIGRRVYDVVARNRHRLPGSTDSCRIDEHQPWSKPR